MSKAKQPFSTMETEKHTVTLSSETVDWLENEYPDALSIQEAIRTAISDARTHNFVVSENTELPDGN
jgi:hypothetical protein